MFEKIAAEGFAAACDAFKLSKEAARRMVSARPGASMPAKAVGAVSDAVQRGATHAANAGMGGMGHVRNFATDQLEHAQGFGGGLRDFAGSLGGTSGTAAGRGMQRSQGLSAMGSGLRGMAPSIGGIAALGAGAYALSGDSAEEKQRKAMMASRGMY